MLQKHQHAKMLCTWVQLLGMILTLTRSWKKLLASEKATESDQQPEDTDAHEEGLEALAKQLDHNLSDEDISNWMKED